MIIPFDKKTVRIEQGIKDSLLDAVVHDRFMRKVERSLSVFGLELDAPELQHNYKGHFKAIDLMGYDSEEYELLRESLGTSYWQVFDEGTPEQAVNLIRESWHVIIREHTTKEAV